MTSDPSDREKDRGGSTDPDEAASDDEADRDEMDRAEGDDVSREGADDGDAEKDGDGPRPISVRDLMPSPSTRPSRRSSSRGEAPPRESPEREEEDTAASDHRAPGSDEADEEEDQEPQAAASVPTPVRVAMDAPPPGDSRPPEELPSRRFEVDGEEWIVRITGRTITGTRPDSGALLMHLSFFRPEEPETPARRLVAVDRPLDALYEEDLAELFHRSRPAEREGVAGAEA